MSRKNQNHSKVDDPIKPVIPIEYDKDGNPIEPPHDGLG